MKVTNQTPRKIPQWLSLQHIAQAWNEETGENTAAFEARFREWFKEFLVRNGYAEAGADGEVDDADIPAQLLEGRQIWRDTFEAFCEDRGHVKPRFWFPGAPVDQPMTRPTKIPMPEATSVKAPGTVSPDSEAAAYAADEEDKKKKSEENPPPPRRAHEGSAAFTRIALGLVLVVVAGLTALWIRGTGEPVAEREGQPGAITLSLEEASPAPAPPEGLVLLLKRELQVAGFDPGPLDDSSSPAFSTVVAAYQRIHDLPIDGGASVDLLSHLARGNWRQSHSALILPPLSALPDQAGGPTNGAEAPDQQTAPQAPATAKSSVPQGRNLVVGIQEHLAARGYYSGPIDGSLGPKTREAIEVYQRAQRIDITGRPSRALFEKLDGYALEVRGLDQFRLGDFDSAILTYTHIVERRPKSADAYFNRGLAYKNAGRTEQALADYDSAIRLDPLHSRAHLDRGNIYYRQGQYVKAIRNYVNALGLQL